MYKIWISLVFRNGYREVGDFINKYSNIKKIFKMSKKEIACLDTSEYYKIKLNNKSLKVKAQKIYDCCNKNDIQILTKQDFLYPKRLKEIKGSPFLIYVKGNLPKEKTIGIIGARNDTPYGRKCCAYFIKHLSKAGYTIVSSLAKGIDIKVHEYSVIYKSKTCAILSGGMLNRYSKTQEMISRIINNNGCVISEYPPYYKTCHKSFWERDRIISGLSKGIVVVEGSVKDGLLKVSNHAAEQGKEVFCIPGNIFSANSEVPGILINEGANIVYSPYDIIEYFNNDKGKKIQKYFTSNR